MSRHSETCQVRPHRGNRFKAMIKMSHQCLCLDCADTSWKSKSWNYCLCQKYFWRGCRSQRVLMCQSLQGEEGQKKTRVWSLVVWGQWVSKNKHSEQDGVGVMKQGDESRLSPGGPHFCKYHSRHFKCDPQCTPQFLEGASWAWRCHCPFGTCVLFWKMPPKVVEEYISSLGHPNKVPQSGRLRQQKRISS